MHVLVLDIMSIRLLIIVSTETCQSFIAQISLYGVNTSDQYIQPTIELLLVQDKWVVNISLHQVFVMERRFRQVCKLFQ